jgi:putative oxidoreductase
MEKAYDATHDFGALTEREYAAFMIRAVVGSLYLCHPLLMWGIFGLDHAARHYDSVGLPLETAYVMAAAELAGGAMLVLGLYVRQVAIALIPAAIGAGFVHFGSDLGAGLSYGVYLLGCLAGQAVLASGILTPQRDTSGEDFAT